MRRYITLDYVYYTKVTGYITYYYSYRDYTGFQWFMLSNDRYSLFERNK
jgi:hypothetical protein